MANRVTAVPPQGGLLARRALRYCAKPKRTLPLSLVSLPLLGLLALAFACRPRRESPDPMGANAGCYVCHMTFVKEQLSVSHLKAQIACVRCHGTSAAHANDENIGATKPDIVYPRSQVNAACRTCHATHDVPPEQVVARWRERVGSHPPPAPVCTDCHGSHRIAKAH